MIAKPPSKAIPVVPGRAPALRAHHFRGATGVADRGARFVHRDGAARAEFKVGPVPLGTGQRILSRARIVA